MTDLTFSPYDGAQFNTGRERTAEINVLSSTIGAVADGVVDAEGVWTGTDNTAAFARAQAVADAMSGAKIKVPAQLNAYIGLLPENISTQTVWEGSDYATHIVAPSNVGSRTYMVSFLRVLRGGDTDDQYNYQNHLYGAGLRNIWLDGNARGPAIGGAKWDMVDRVICDNVNIRSFRGTGMKLSSSIRESAILAPYINHCGTETQPGFDLEDLTSQDGSNDLFIYAMRIVACHGTQMRIQRAFATGNIRNIYVIGTMLHGPATNSDPIVADQAEYELDASFYVGHALELRSARGVFVMGRLNAHGRGFAHIFVGQPVGPQPNAVVNSINVIGGAFGTSVDSDAGGFTQAVTRTGDTLNASDLRLSTGAVFRVAAGVGGLSANTDYFAIYQTDHSIKVASTLENAENGTAITLSAGDGNLTTRDIKIHVDPRAGSAPIIGITASTFDTPDDSLPALVSFHSRGSAVFRVDNVSTGATKGVANSGVELTKAASATSLQITGGCRLYRLTGTTTVTSINSNSAALDREVTLVAEDTVQVSDGNNLKLAGNWSATAGDTLTIVCDGVDWYEKCRSNND